MKIGDTLTIGTGPNAETVEALRTALADNGRDVAQRMLVFTLTAVLLVLTLALWMVRTTNNGLYSVRRVISSHAALV